MPTYDYQCSDCGCVIELSHKISDAPIKDCPSCKQPTLQRGVGGGTATLLFKGKGFYITDYRKDSDEVKEKAGCGCKGTHSCG